MSVKVHNVRFYDLEPKSINVMACEESLNLLALSRSDNSIEVWNLSHSPYIERTIVGTCGTIEDLAWFNKRLFSGGLQGSIIEYDLCSQTAKGFHPVTSGACWCIAVEKNRKQVAAGTEDGYINIFDISDDDLLYTRLLDRQEGRILCLKWDSTGNHIVTGSVDTVRVWNVAMGHAVHRMNTGRAVNSAPTVVWALDISRDFTIVTGDSRGMLCFWDGNKGTSIASFRSHRADVLSVCFDGAQQSVFCAGVDPLIVSYEKLKMRRGETKWARSLHRLLHDHDVRCLTFCNGTLYSAGVDGYLATSRYPPKVLLKFPPVLQPPSVSLADGRLLLLRYPLCLELWRLGSHEDDIPVKLLKWQPPSDYHIKCAQISKDSNWLACSTLDKFRLYSIRYDGGIPSLKVVRVNNVKGSLVAHRVCFSGDSKTLVIATLNSSIKVIDLSIDKLSANASYSFHPLKTRDTTDSILHLAVSEYGKYVVGVDTDSNIVVWSQGEVHVKLPTYKCAPTAIAIHPTTNNLVIVYSDRMLVEYSLESRRLTDMVDALNGKDIPKHWTLRSFCVQGIAFDPANEDTIILHDECFILVIRKNKESDKHSVKVAKLEVYTEGSNEESVHHSMVKTNQIALNVIKKSKHLVYFGTLCDGEMVAVSISPLSFMKKLPPPSLFHKQFGKM